MKIKCVYCSSSSQNPSVQRRVKRISFYFRKSDGQTLRRFWCFGCQKSFSAATRSPKKGHKKRHLRRRIVALLLGGVSQREAARILKINRKTVVRQFRFSIPFAQQQLREHNASKPAAVEVEFDDLETFEHTKCKPLSVTLMVEYGSRRILGFRVSRMPAKGLLAAVSRKKYGYRKDERPAARRELFAEMLPLVAKGARVRSDSNPHYLKDVKKYFPSSPYETVLGGRGAVTGQGELKKLQFDPIFSLNHTCAMLRAHINRLFRKTWCTTKRPDQLEGHIALYALSHNLRLETRKGASFERSGVGVASEAEG